MLPPETSPTLTLDTSQPYSTSASDDLTPVASAQTLTIPASSRSASTSSAYEDALANHDVTATSGSRPVSMISATSETTSDEASATADDEGPTHDDDDDDDMLRTLTSHTLSK